MGVFLRRYYDGMTDLGQLVFGYFIVCYGDPLFLERDIDVFERQS